MLFCIIGKQFNRTSFFLLLSFVYSSFFVLFCLFVIIALQLQMIPALKHVTVM